MTKYKALNLLVCIIIFGSCVEILGQQGTVSPEEIQINLKRDAIRQLEAKSPVAGAEETYRANLARLRNELRDLLVEKRGAIKKDINDLQNSPSKSEFTEYLNQLQTLLQAVNAEVESLGGNSSTVMSPRVSQQSADNPGTGGQVAGTTKEEAPEQTAKRLAFTAAVNDSKTQLADAVAPAELASTKIAESSCNAEGRPSSTTFSRLDENVCRLASNVNKRRDSKIILLSRDQAQLFAILIPKLLKTTGDESFVSFITEAQEKRLDQQMGAGPDAPGTTSLVVKGGVPSFLGFAVENGAATQSQSGTTMTFRINPAGTLNLLANKGFITGFRQAQNDPVMNLLRKTSVGVSFDTSRGSQPGVFTGDKQQLAAISARFEFVNDRDPRLKKYEADWEQFVENDGVRLAETISATTIALNDFGTATSSISFKDPALQAWLEATNDLVAAVDSSLSPSDRINAIAKVVRQQADLLPVKIVSGETVQALTGFAKNFKAYTDKKNEILDRIAKSRILTLEYTNTRGVNAPDTSNFNFIAATGMGARVDLTANGSFTFFNKLPVATTTTSPRPGRIRDFQFAGQINMPIPIHKKGDSNSKDDMQLDFWFSGRYERLMEDASTMAGTIMPNTKGDIAVGQFGINVPIKGLGIKFPISVTFASRTELVKEKVIRGNFGFTFNWDTLLAKIKPF